MKGTISHVEHTVVSLVYFVYFDSVAFPAATLGSLGSGMVTSSKSMPLAASTPTEEQSSFASP